MGNFEYVSGIWWHFTGYGKTEKEAFEILGKILDSGKILAQEGQIILTSAGAGTELDKVESQTYFEGPRACLADIPLGSLHYHADRYGKIGLGLKRDSLRKENIKINPVMYLEDFLYEKLKEHLLKNHDEKSTEFKLIQSYIKFRGADEFLPIYREREWRSLDPIPVGKNNLACLVVPESFYDQAIDLKTGIPVLTWELIQAQELEDEK